jgi:DNA N-6-adenine-methyltransferase (Dam)
MERPSRKQTKGGAMMASSPLLSSKSNEWYTPSVYIAAARAVMGMVDLDPASCALANETVCANRFYCKENNGLMYPWYGCVWLNPPYGKTNGESNQGIWTCKLISEYRIGRVKQAVELVNAAVDTGWFQELWQFPICFPSGRISFYGSPSSNPAHANAFVYLGPNEQKFVETFEQFGPIVRLISHVKQSVWTPELWNSEVA